MTTDEPIKPDERIRVKVFGDDIHGYTWRVYRRGRWFWYVANWGNEETFDEARRIVAIELRAGMGKVA